MIVSDESLYTIYIGTAGYQVKQKQTLPIDW